MRVNAAGVLAVVMLLVSCGGEVGSSDATRQESGIGGIIKFHLPSMSFADYPGGKDSAGKDIGWVHVTGSWLPASDGTIEIDFTQQSWHWLFSQNVTISPDGGVDEWIFHRFDAEGSQPGQLLQGVPVQMHAYTQNNGPWWEHDSSAWSQ